MQWQNGFPEVLTMWEEVGGRLLQSFYEHYTTTGELSTPLAAHLPSGGHYATKWPCRSLAALLDVVGPGQNAESWG